MAKKKKKKYIFHRLIPRTVEHCKGLLLSRVASARITVLMRLNLEKWNFNPILRTWLLVLYVMVPQTNSFSFGLKKIGNLTIREVISQIVKITMPYKMKEGCLKLRGAV
jgi:hypothetical protein